MQLQVCLDEEPGGTEGMVRGPHITNMLECSRVPVLTEILSQTNI